MIYDNNYLENTTAERIFESYFDYNQRICGEILLSNKRLLIICCLCEKVLHKIEVFPNHLREEHCIFLEDNHENQELQVECDNKNNDNDFVKESFQYKTIDEKVPSSKIVPNIQPISALTTKRGNLFKCPECFKKYTKFDSLKIHFRIHTGEKNPYNCKNCDKAFITSTKLREHERVHSGERPFSCTICQRSFKTKQKLQYHMESHKKGTLRVSTFTVPDQTDHLPILINNKFVKPSDTKKSDGLFHCPLCENVFIHFEKLHKHSESHLEIKQYECKICKKKFQKLDLLNSHIESHQPKLHTRWKSSGSITCDYCEKTYHNKYYLNEHIRGVHECKTPHECKICKCKFAFKNNYVAHLKTHFKNKR